MQPGQRLTVESLGELQIHDVTQRNWSRIATATHAGDRYFLKQFIDRVGVRHERGFAGDQETLDLLGEQVLPGIRTVPVVARLDDELITVSPHVAMTTIDSIAKMEARHVDDAVHVGNALHDILMSRRTDTDPARVSLWKGIDPKNIGWEADGSLWVFDFGPPSELPIERAAARVMAAGLLCRWVARPGRHLVLPETPILRGVCEPLAPLTNFEAVEAELATHAELRRREPQRVGLRGTATRLGLQTLGRAHWRVVQRQARKMFHDQ